MFKETRQKIKKYIITKDIEPKITFRKNYIKSQHKT